MHVGFLLPAIVGILFGFFFFSPSIAGNQATCQLLNSSVVISTANNTKLPEDRNFTGTVKAEPNFLNSTEPKLNMSLTEAASKAEKLIGNDSRVIDAKLGVRNGYVVYEVLLMGKGPDRPFTWLVIDPGNGNTFAAKMTCKCTECKPFAGKWICTGCTCTPELEEPAPNK